MKAQGDKKAPSVRPQGAHLSQRSSSSYFRRKKSKKPSEDLTIKRFSPISWLILLALIFVQVVTYLSWNQAHTRLTALSETAFKSEVEDITSSFNSRLQSYLDTLNGFVGLFSASDEVSAQEFSAYYQALDLKKNHPGLRSISYLAAVKTEDITAFEQQQRAFNNPTFTVKSLSDKEIHFIGTYNAAEPTSAALGTDVSSIPGRYEIYNRALAARKAVGSGDIAFAATANQKAKRGFFITTPVKSAGANTYEGLVNVNFNNEDFFPALLREIDTSKLELRIIDTTSGTTIFQQGSDKEGGPSTDITIPVVDGKTWQLHVEAPKYYGIPNRQHRTPNAIVVSGQLFALLLAIIFVLQTRGRKRAIQLAKKATAELEKERNKLLELNTRSEAILAGIGDGLIVVNKHGVIELVNDAAQRLLDMKGSELVGNQVAKVLPIYNDDGTKIPEDERPINQVLATGEIVESKLHYRRKNGSPFPAQLTVAPVVLNNKITGTIEIFRDFTEEVELDKAKTEFVSIASHQLRTPLSAVNWYVEMLLSGDAGKMNKAQRDYLTQIYTSNNRMIALVSSLLDVSRLDLGRIINKPEPIEMGAMIDAIEKDFHPLITARSQNFTVTIDPSDLTINADPKLMQMIVQSLFSNAIKYSPANSTITIDMRYATAAELRSADLPPRTKAAIFSVTDSGRGIPQVQQTKVFQKFFRGDNIHDVDVDGVGLGLYTAREIIEKLGGRIWFVSEQNKGSTFTFILPINTKVISEDDLPNLRRSP